MAAATAFGLAVPHEDSMDMSSPARHDDGDIDIDFEDDSNYVHDEHMVEDGDLRPSTATDAEMDDDALHHGHVVHEEEMSDPVGVDDHTQDNVQDDELIDYDEDEDEEVDHNETSHAVTQDFVPKPQASHVEIANVAAQPESIVETSQVLETSLNAHEDFSAEQTEIDTQVHDRSRDAEDEHSGHAGEDDLHGDNEASNENVTTSQYDDADTADAGVDAAAEDQHDTARQLSVDTTAPVADVDGPATPTDTGLHPVILYFNEQEMPLFRSKHHPDGLLTNDNLASLSLAELMKHCKERLADRGEEFPEQKEAVLSFDHMALMLYEASYLQSSFPAPSLTVSQSSRAAYECSLNDVLETFLQLYRNDGLTDIPPMFLALSLQLKFSSSLDFLKQLAATGHGISNVPGYEPQNPEEHEEYGQTHEETGEEQENYEQHDVDHHGEIEDEYQYEPEEYNDDHDDAHDEEQHDEGQQYDNPAAEGGFEHDDGTGNNEPQLDLSGTTDAEEHGPNVEIQSAASSATLQDDTAQYDNSKSDDDLIDYTFDDEDDELTPNVAAEADNSTGYEQKTDAGEYFELDIIDWDDLTRNDTEADADQAEASEAKEREQVEDHEAVEPEAELHEYDDDEAPAEHELNHGASPKQVGEEEQGDIFDNYPDDETRDDQNEEFSTALDLQADFDDDGAEPEVAPVGNDADPADFLNNTAEDDADELIDYDDDTTEEHNQKIAAAATQTQTARAPAPSSPLGKRSFEEDDDLIFDEEPTPKKHRAG